MRRLAAALAAVSLAGGCGGDDDEGGGSAKTATSPTATSDAGAGSSGPVDKAELESCLAKSELQLRPGDTPYRDRRGQQRTRQGIDMAGTRYEGYVMWPSRHIADVYVSRDEKAARAGQAKAGAFVRAFGLDPAAYVQRHGNLVLVFDRPVPTADEVQQVADCA